MRGGGGAGITRVRVDNPLQNLSPSVDNGIAEAMYRGEIVTFFCSRIVVRMSSFGSHNFCRHC